MPAYCFIIFPFCGRSVARSRCRARGRGTIFLKAERIGNTVGVHCNADAYLRVGAVRIGSTRRSCASGRIPLLAWVRSTSAALKLFRSRGPPFAAAAPQTYGKRPIAWPAARRVSAALAAQKATAAARNLLPDWQAQDTVWPATGNTRRSRPTTYSSRKAHIWPLGLGNAALPLYDRPSLARRPQVARACSGHRRRVKAGCG
jgi:hypothetical protein